MNGIRLLFISLFLTTIGATTAATTWAQVNVNNVIFTFTASGRPVQNIQVTNSSNAPVYVSVKTEAMIDYTKRPIESGPTEDILVSPKSFSIEANGQRTVRMLLKKPATELERGYRVYFIPEMNEFGAGTVTKTEQGRTAIIKVATGVGVLVFVDPHETKVSFTNKRDPTGITFTNSGNIQVYMGDGKACPIGVPFPPIGSFGDNAEIGKDPKHPDPKGCYNLPSQRVYAGTTFHIDVPLNLSVRYLKRVGSDGPYEAFDSVGLKDQ